MGLEIERKFLIKNDNWKSKITKSFEIKQGYLSLDVERTVRIRITENIGLITIKGKTENLSRLEFEYNIPLDDAKELLILCKKPILEKTRHIFIASGNHWEIDVFEGDNDGLIVAEIELESENTEISLPDWIGKEVSIDPKYYNSSLISHPFSNWKNK